MTTPSPEAIDAACHLLNKLDTDHITEIRAASRVIATHVLARALDEFARQAVERHNKAATMHAQIILRDLDRNRKQP